LARSLLGYRLLTPTQRVRAIFASLALNRVDRRAAVSDTSTFRDWLLAHGQSDAAIERLFDVFTVATLNAPAAQVSLTLAAMVFQDGLLRRSDACDIGIALVPLGQLHGDAAEAALVAAGGAVHLRARVRRIVAQPDRRWRVETDDSAIEADAVALAVPHQVAADLLPDDAVAEPELVRGLDVAPIINVHVVFDRVVLHEPFVGAVGSPVQFVFDRTVQSGLAARDDGGQYVAVSVSAADAWIDEPVERLREIFLPELARVLPATGDAVVRDFFVTREREATFRPVPGSAARRLPTVTKVPGLVVAGAWTDTGWPATMEGAVRSGVAAAQALETQRAELTHSQPFT
jgi:squalene-associated FAD-dependent desaturase